MDPDNAATRLSLDLPVAIKAGPGEKRRPARAGENCLAE